VNEEHDRYAMLCVLASAGQLTASERTQLHSHAEGCPRCRTHFVELEQLGEVLISAIPSKYVAPFSAPEMTSVLLQRFQARAIREGIHLTRTHASQSRSSFRKVLLCVAMALLVFTLHPWSYIGSTRSQRLFVYTVENSFATPPRSDLQVSEAMLAHPFSPRRGHHTYRRSGKSNVRRIFARQPNSYRPFGLSLPVAFANVETPRAKFKVVVPSVSTAFDWTSPSRQTIWNSQLLKPLPWSVIDDQCFAHDLDVLRLIDSPQSRPTLYRFQLGQDSPQ
jgi:hypothetical protein